MYKKLFITLLFVCVFCNAGAQDFAPFLGVVNSDDINLRADSTVSGEVICKVKKGQRVDIISQAYDWYKIRLPENAPSFIRKDMVALIDEKTPEPYTPAADTKTAQARPQSAKVIKNRINIRLHPSETAFIVGKLDKGEIISITQSTGEWYKIAPSRESFGWIHKKFIDNLPQKEALLASQKTPQVNAEIISVEGVVKPYGMVLRRQATHKLISQDNKTFLLKENKKKLNSLNNHKVKVTGKLIPPADAQKIPIIEVEKIEAID